MLLGIGGVRALRAYSRLTGAPAPEVFHTNEGHAGFLGLERIRRLVKGSDMTFPEAVEAVRAGTVFTTHTPVPAGIDRFSRDLVAQHFGGDNACPGVPVERVLALGAEDFEGGDPSIFNMAVMGFRLAQRANGVSELHGQVARDMFARLWPGFDEPEVPIGHVTNGVHLPTWVQQELGSIYDRYLGAEWRSRQDDAAVWSKVAAIPDEVLWLQHNKNKSQLLQAMRGRARKRWMTAMMTSPLSTATPDRAMNPMPALIDSGMSRRTRAAIPPVSASGTPLNTRAKRAPMLRASIPSVDGRSPTMISTGPTRSFTRATMASWGLPATSGTAELA